MISTGKLGPGVGLVPVEGFQVVADVLLVEGFLGPARLVFRLPASSGRSPESGFHR
jgi:hypothetical protein